MVLVDDRTDDDLLLVDGPVDDRTVDDLVLVDDRTVDDLVLVDDRTVNDYVLVDDRTVDDLVQVDDRTSDYLVLVDDRTVDDLVLVCVTVDDRSFQIPLNLQKVTSVKNIRHSLKTEIKQQNVKVLLTNHELLTKAIIRQMH